MTDSKFSRRDFLKLAGTGAATTAVLTGCGPASRYVVREPYAKMPEYTYNGESYAPEQSRGPAPECRISISPRSSATEDFFLTILTATDSSVNQPLPARHSETDESVTVRLGEDLIEFQKRRVVGRIEIKGIERELTGQVLAGR